MDGFGASETGGQGSLVGQTGDGAPVFQMGPGNVVIADDGTLCAPGDGRMGMLATSGHIPLGYYKDEAKTAATFPVVDGVRYAVPGDMAKLLEDGTIAVYGRGSVSINSGGEKIFPEEVEKALKSHPAVFDAIVVGTPSERWGSQVTAVVQLRTGLGRDAGPRGAARPLPRPPGRVQAPPCGRVRRRRAALTVGQARLPMGEGRRPRRPGGHRSRRARRAARPLGSHPPRWRRVDRDGGMADTCSPGSRRRPAPCCTTVPAGSWSSSPPTSRAGPIPGGQIEEDGESPWEGCRREVAEETGLVVDAGRLVCVDFLRPRPGRPGGLRFLFDCGVVDADHRARLLLQEEEIEDARWATADEADELLSGPVGRRVARALGADRTVYLEDGRPVPGVSG